jgi:N,N'-diacetylchitobiose transport system substrate-binding protein
VTQLSRASKTGDELKQDQTFAQGHVAAIVANGWEWGVILDKKQGDPALASKLGAFPMPGRKPGTFMPTFLGGSDLGVPVTSQNKSLAVDWIKAFTSATNERALATGAGVIPNTTTLLTVNKSKKNLAPFAAAANFSWFVPTAPNWADVESANVLPNMLVQIATGKQSVANAAKAADAKITSILNKSQ